MFLAKHLRAVRALSLAATTTIVAATALVGSGPATAVETYLRPVGSVVTLAGHGYGHGHGMSQYGAWGAAQRGRTWQQIVDFYYPGTTRTAVGNPTLRVSVAGGLGDRVVVLPAAGLRASYGTARTSLTALPVTSFGQPILYWYVARSGTGAVLRFARKDNKTFTYPAVTGTQVNLENSSNKVVAQSSSGALITYVGRLSGVAVGTSTVKPVLSLPMESYLKTVVPSEMPASWTRAAVSAQSVAARTYAYYSLRHPSTTYDICDTTTCQVFNGTSRVSAGRTTTYEYAASNAAIAATAGTVLAYEGAVAFTQFSSSNGGWTSAGAQGYLVAKADPFDGIAANANSTWSATVRVSTIEDRWPSIGTYRALQVRSRVGHGQWGGRIVTASVVGSAGTVNVTGAALRAALGLRSEWLIPTNVGSAPSYPRDFSGDHMADVLAVVARTGDLGMYAGNGASGWAPFKVVRRGFGGAWKPFTAGTWTADALSDVMAVGTDGSLWLYPGSAGGPLAPRRKIASGFGIYNHLFPVGDFGGDGRTDLLARRSDGRLVLYNGSGSGGFLGYRTVGAGWSSFTALLSPGDFSGDGRTDVMARSSAGVLYLYPGNGSGGWLPRRTIGRGWNGFTLTSSGDIDGDGRSDLLARSTDGTLWMYPGNGTGSFLPRRAVGAGWNMFSAILR